MSLEFFFEVHNFSGDFCVDCCRWASLEFDSESVCTKECLDLILKNFCEFFVSVGRVRVDSCYFNWLATVCFVCFFEVFKSEFFVVTSLCYFVTVNSDSLSFTFCYALDNEAAVETVNELLNPYTRDLTLEDMNILSGT